MTRLNPAIAQYLSEEHGKKIIIKKTLYQYCNRKNYPCPSSFY